MKEVLYKIIQNELTVKKTEKLIKDIIESLEAQEEPEKKQSIKASVGNLRSALACLSVNPFSTNLIFTSDGNLKILSLLAIVD